MQRLRIYLVSVLVVVCLAGCANLRRWERVDVGMGPDEVKWLMGVPRELDAGDEGQGLQGCWVYENLWGTSRYEIIFDKGKVAEKHVRTISPW